MNQLARRLTLEIPSSNGNGVLSEKADEFFKQEYISKLKGKTKGQQEALITFDKNIVTLCHGPAGTGKTYLAIGKALEWLLSTKKINKIILCRPAIECGTRLGFLPGDKDSKIEPYMEPLMDKLHIFLDKKEVEKLIRDEKIEVKALAYMRGKSIDGACLILDEAQNAKSSEILMFLTRLGNNSLAIVCGDTDQTDLEERFAHAYARYIHESNKHPYIDGFDVARLTEDDIVRSTIVQAIVKKYGKI